MIYTYIYMSIHIYIYIIYIYVQGLQRDATAEYCDLYGRRLPMTVFIIPVTIMILTGTRRLTVGQSLVYAHSSP